LAQHSACVGQGGINRRISRRDIVPLGHQLPQIAIGFHNANFATVGCAKASCVSLADRSCADNEYSVLHRGALVSTLPVDDSGERLFVAESPIIVDERVDLARSLVPCAAAGGLDDNHVGPLPQWIQNWPYRCRGNNRIISGNSAAFHNAATGSKIAVCAKAMASTVFELGLKNR